MVFCYRITRAFLIEEVKLMKRMLQQKDKSSKKSKKNKGKGKKKMWVPYSLIQAKLAAIDFL